MLVGFEEGMSPRASQAASPILGKAKRSKTVLIAGSQVFCAPPGAILAGRQRLERLKQGS